MARFEHPHDRQMRSVPDRPGLIERLREVAVADEALSQWLTDVSVPAGLAGRLQRGVFDDAVLDEMLCDPSIPEDFVANIQAAVLDDACLDTILSEIPAPAGFIARLQLSAEDTEHEVTVAVRSGSSQSHYGRPGRPGLRVGASRLGQPASAPWRRRLTNVVWGSAAALLLVVIQWGAVYRLAASLAPAATASDAELLVADWGPLDVAVSMVDGFEETLVVMESFEPVERPVSDVLDVELRQWELPPRSVFQQLTSEVSAGLDLNLDVWSTRIEHVGYPARESLSPAAMDQVQVGRVTLPGLPRHRAYDRVFHWRHGVSPWVPATAISKQQLSLGADPRRFQRLLLQMEDSHPIDVSEVAVEDALATMDPRLPMPSDGRVALRTAAGPSIFGERGAALLQIGVAAGAPANRLISPVRLTVLLDVSAEVSAAEFLTTQRQLIAALRMLRSEDLLTIITIGDEPKVLCEDVGPEQLEAVRAILDEHPRQGIADWGRAIPRGVQAALEGQRSGMRQQLLVITSGRGEWADSAAQWMDRALVEAKRWGVEVAICGHDARLTGRVRDWADHHELPWTSAAAGIQRAVCESLAGAGPQALPTSGPSVTIAQDVRVTIEFNPKAVAAYRVLGQDASAGQWTDDPAPIEMQAGDQQHSLIEIRWAGEHDDVGWVTMAWNDTQGQLHKHRQRVSRIQFAPSFQQSAASLQSAILAAEAAQILMDSPFAKGRGHKISNVLEQFWECSEQVRSQPELRRLIRALEMIDRSRDTGQNSDP